MRKSYLFVMVLLCTFIACKKDKTSPIGTGLLELNVGLDISQNQLNTHFKSAQANPDSFIVVIYTGAGEVVSEYDMAMEIPANIELDAGTYYVEASYGDPSGVAFEEPYYMGSSGEFTIDVEETRFVNVSCQISNCAVSVVYSGSIVSDFITYSTHISTAAGSLVYGENESRKGFFPIQSITVNATLAYELADQSLNYKYLSGEISTPLPGTHYEIQLDASVNQGTIQIDVQNSDEMSLEVVSISEGAAGAGVSYGDVLITEIMFNPDAMSDTYGEWFELYNAGTENIDLNGMVLATASGSHTVATSVSIAAGDYVVMGRTDTATANVDYVYGSSLSLTNAGTSLGLYTYGSDGTNGQEICSVEYTSANGFPTATGA